MSHENFDVIVAGLGAMGSATACHLALRGCHVLGLDRWAPGHTMGSSHGESRIIRELYYERPIYVPLVQRAYELWRDLEARTGRTLLYETSGLMIGPPTGDLITGARRSGSTYHLPYEVLSANELHRRFPAFTLPDGYVALLDPHAGYLTPEACVDAHLQIARAHGAMLRFEEPVVDWSAHEGGIQVVTPRGIYAAGRLVINAGAYGRALLANLDLPLTVERQTLFWFEVSAAGARYDAPSFPIYMHEDEHARLCYGFPRLQRGVKAAVMHEGKIIRDPEHVERSVLHTEVEPLRRALAGILPDLAAASVRESAVCLFTNTPDHHFLIDHHPQYPQVLVSSPCSGHGFKFASAIGELQADLLTEGRTRFDLAPFRLARFARAPRD
jgi:sarcosine oxidase